MSTFLIILGFLSTIVFGILSLVGLIKKNGKAKKRGIYTAISFVVFIIGVTTMQPSSETVSTKSKQPVVNNEEIKTKETQPKQEQNSTPATTTPQQETTQPAAPTPTPKPSPEPEKKGITKAEFDQIHTGMTYEEVVKVIGTEGELLSESGDKGTQYYTVMYQWNGESGIANANAMFQGGKLINKAQFGLQ